MLGETIDCLPFEARLTERGCRANQQAAWEAIVSIDDRGTLGGVKRGQLERVVLCGRCPLSSISKEQLEKTWQQAVEKIRVGFDRLDFDGRIKPEEKPPPPSKNNVRMSTLDSQIAKLRAKIGGAK